MKPMTLRTIHSFGLRSPSSSPAAQRARCSSPTRSPSALDIQASPPIHPVLEAGPGAPHHALEVVALAVAATQDRLDHHLGRGDAELLGEQPRRTRIQAPHVLHVERAVAGAVGEEQLRPVLVLAPPVVTYVHLR